MKIKESLKFKRNALVKEVVEKMKKESKKRDGTIAIAPKDGTRPIVIATWTRSNI